MAPTLPTIAKSVASAGQGKDNILIHINSSQLPTIASALGHKGKVNPKTGYLGFDPDGASDGPGGSVGDGGTNGTDSGTSGNGQQSSSATASEAAQNAADTASSLGGVGTDQSKSQTAVEKDTLSDPAVTGLDAATTNS